MIKVLSRNTHSYCSDELRPSILKAMNKYSPDQINSFKAMLELSCSYENMYAIGEELCLLKNTKIRL